MVFGQKQEKDAIGKSTSRGDEWCKFQLHSTFQWGVMGVERNLIETEL